jgi:hypothetical protein
LLKHVCKMIGKLEVVDKEALKGRGPDRVKIKCRDPESALLYRVLFQRCGSGCYF